MNHNRITTIKRLALCLIPAWSLFATALLAHGGFDHVIGTVVVVQNNVLTVKTSKGNVDVRLNDQTELTRGDQKAQIADLKPGARVVVDIPEGSKDKVAHSVKVGMAGTAATHAHPQQK